MLWNIEQMKKKGKLSRTDLDLLGLGESSLDKDFSRNFATISIEEAPDENQESWQETHRSSTVYVPPRKS